MIDGVMLMFGDVMQDLQPVHGCPEQQQVLSAGAHAATAATGASDGLMVGNACGDSGPRGCAVKFQGAKVVNLSGVVAGPNSA
eukprot:SAG31_NODE_22109_length_533_cov_1.557604_1_plen_82_part_10